MSFDLFESFKSALDRLALWKKGEAVLIAASGGPDSTGLLDLFARLQEESPFPLAVVHLNHGLRGDESDADERFVETLAKRHNLSFHVRRISRVELEGTTEGLEAAARKARYRFLRETARTTGSSRVALGHTREDQSETLLMRLLRGSGRRGLGGIHPCVDGIFIRPLLEVSRETVKAYLLRRGETWREDSSNQDLRRMRNRVRHRLMPLLRQEFNPEIDAVLARTATFFREEDEFLDTLTVDLARRLIRNEAQGFCLSIPALRVLPAALRRRLLRSFLEGASPDSAPPDFETTAALETLVREGRHRAAVTLRPDLEARVIYSDLLLLPPQAAPEPDAVPLPVPGEAALPDLGVRLSARQMSPSEVGDPRITTIPGRALLDADALPGPLLVRRRRNGDLFRPLGAPGESKLKSYFIDHKVPRPVRDRIPLVVAGDKIAWVVGYQIDDRFKVTPRTRRVVVLSKELQ